MEAQALAMSIEHLYDDVKYVDDDVTHTQMNGGTGVGDVCLLLGVVRVLVLICALYVSLSLYVSIQALAMFVSFSSQLLRHWLPVEGAGVCVCVCVCVRVCV